MHRLLAMMMSMVFVMMVSIVSMVLLACCWCVVDGIVDSGVNVVVYAVDGVVDDIVDGY